VKKICAIIIVIFCLSSAYAQDAVSEKFVSATQKASPSVVSIQVFVVEKGHYRKVGYASGTIISSKGYVITNYHVVSKGTVYQINLADGTECEVESFSDGSTYRVDEKTDIALLKVRHPSGIPLQAIEVEDEKVYPGQWVLAIGNPFGLQQSVTGGIVSSVGRSDIGFADIEDYIQTDVPINPGNSGGPLVSLNGKLVGINTAIRTQTGGYQGISFAIPASIVKQVAGELIQYGRVRRGWLGFLVQEKFIKDGTQTQVEVISVVDGSPASRAGIEVGDIVRRVDGVQVKKISDLVKSIHSKQVGSSIELVIARDGQLQTYNFVLQEKTKGKEGNYWINTLQSRYGITVDDSRNGVVIVEVLQFGQAYNLLKKGDILQSINGVRVATMQDVIALLKKHNGVMEYCIVLRAGKAIRCYFDSQEVE